MVPSEPRRARRVRSPSVGRHFRGLVERFLPLALIPSLPGLEGFRPKSPKGSPDERAKTASCARPPTSTGNAVSHGAVGAWINPGRGHGHTSIATTDPRRSGRFQLQRRLPTFRQCFPNDVADFERTLPALAARAEFPAETAQVADSTFLDHLANLTVRDALADADIHGCRVVFPKWMEVSLIQTRMIIKTPDRLLPDAAAPLARQNPP